MAEFALRELIDEKRLQHLQNEFCKVTGVMAVCVDKEGRAITEPYIDKSLIRPDGEDPILGEYRKKAAQALDRVQEGSLEEQVVDPDTGFRAGTYRTSWLPGLSSIAAICLMCISQGTCVRR